MMTNSTKMLQKTKEIDNNGSTNNKNRFTIITILNFEYLTNS